MSDKSPEAIYNSLIDLGLPRELISLDDFGRVYRGPLQDAILFFSEHVRGRAGVMEARAQSFSYQRSSNERSASDIAASRLAKARQDVQIYNNLLGKKLKLAEETHAQINALKQELEAKRRIELMLETLERKEKERLKRFKEIGKMLTELKDKVPQIQHLPKENIPTPGHSFGIVEMSASKKPRYTLDTMTTLNAYHVRLARLSRSLSSIEESAESQFRFLVARKLGVEDRNSEVSRVFEEFAKVAREQAKHHVQSHSIMENNREVSRRDLDMFALKKRNTTILQDAFNLSLKLAHDSELALAFMSNFEATIASTQKKIIYSHSSAMRNYIDQLRAHSMVADESKPWLDIKPVFDQEAKRILGLNDASTSEQVLEETGRLVRIVHDTGERLQAIEIPSPLSSNENDLEILASFESSQKEMVNSSEKLLTRKIAKADLGQGLIQDIEILLNGLQDVIGPEHRGDKR
ncbi:hypothetical protein GYMLUDRAFT_758437 [Collybiopsis luxurians FD-317 M1]|uniref:Uncharacterized protein n=1 Tax=Collybiopsis luxurians FD-317 M1 TaxID=944289 RepID=A0A0D0BQL0_9AGAR|nr:hypothetical protein GYMLUDRAFT_758437 [Collybiopsis luxurians FD-317 M1]